MYEMKKYIRDYPYNFHTIISETVKKNYCWIGMSKGQIRKLILQLKIIKEQITQDEEDEINEDTYKKFEDNELSIIKCIRYEPDPAIRLKLLWDEGFIKEHEYNQLI